MNTNGKASDTSIHTIPNPILIFGWSRVRDDTELDVDASFAGWTTV
jgi:hypothetical protein